MDLLKRLFGGDEPPRPFEHPVLGALAFDPDTRSWSRDCQAEGRTLRLSVGGTNAPDTALVERAVAVCADLAGWLARVREYLDTEGVVRQSDRDELHHLIVEEIAYWWPDKPDHAMVFFEPTDTGRL